MLEPGHEADAAPYDVVLELVGAPSLAAVLPHLATGARVVVIGVGGGAQMDLNLFSLMGTRARVGGSTLRGRSRSEKADVAAAMAAHVVPALAAGRIRGPGLRDLPPVRGAGGLRPLRRGRQAGQGRARPRFRLRRRMIQAVLFDGDQTLWDFERVMRDALIAVADELRAARPGPFADGLTWQDLQDDRTFVAGAMPDVWSLAELRVHGFARTLARRRAVEGGDEREDEALAADLGASYFVHRDRDPALFPDTRPGLDALRAATASACSPTGAACPRRSGSPGTSSRWSSHRTTAWPSRTRGSSRWWNGSWASGRPRACWWATTPSTTSPGRTVRAGAAVWLDRDGTVPFPDDGPRPDAVIASLLDLPGLLPRLGGD